MNVNVAEALARLLLDESTYQHSKRVASMADSHVAKQVAWLHDILEDTECREEDLRTFSFDTDVVVAVRTLTKRPGMIYKNYILNIKNSENNLAIPVKMLDLHDNLIRLDWPKDKESNNGECPQWAVDKYKMALRILQSE